MRTPLRRLLTASLCAVSALFVTAPHAHAQGSLTRQLVDEANPSDAQLTQITRIATELSQTLANSDDPREVEKARRDLLAPFIRFQEQSVAFRLRWGRAVAFELREAVVDEDIRRAVNALAALGPTGVPEAVEVLERAVMDDRTAVRLAAATALGDAIQVDTRTASFREPAIASLNVAARALKKERDPAVASALVSSMAVPQGRADLVPTASALLTEAIPEIVPALPDGFDHLVWAKAMSRAGVTARTGAINASQNAASASTTLRQTTRALTFNLALVHRVLDETEDPTSIEGTQLGDALENLVATASSQIQLAMQNAGSNLPVPSLLDALSRSIERGDADEFRTAFEQLRPALQAMRVGDDAIDLVAP